MYDEEREGSIIPEIWFYLHILATALSIVKLCGGIPDWPWWIVLAPFIFDLAVLIAIVFCICVIFSFSTISHRDH